VLRTILLVHPGGLGDVILALPAIRALRRAYPGHACGMLTCREVGNLYCRAGEVDRSFSLESSFLAQLFAGPEFVTPDFQDWLVRCDEAVCWMSDTTGCVRSTLQAFGVRRVIVQSPRVSDHPPMHQSDRLLRAIRLDFVEGVAGERNDRKLNLPHDVIEGARKWLKEAGVRDGHPVVAVHPGSGSRHKCCQPAVLAKIVDLLAADAKVPILIQGPADADMVRLVCNQVSKPLEVIRNLDLLTVAGILAQAVLYIGHDSGITHLAAALGAPTVALFGPTDRQRWAPRGSNVKVITGNACQCRTWETVQQCTRKPCLEISAERVIATCMDLLSGLPSTTKPAPLPCHVL
jgi:heptosyltransferase-3